MENFTLFTFYYNAVCAMAARMLMDDDTQLFWDTLCACIEADGETAGFYVDDPYIYDNIKKPCGVACVVNPEFDVFIPGRLVFDREARTVQLIIV